MNVLGTGTVTSMLSVPRSATVTLKVPLAAGRCAELIGPVGKRRREIDPGDAEAGDREGLERGAQAGRQTPVEREGEQHRDDDGEQGEERIAQLPVAHDLRRRVHPLVSFFIAVFFVSLGVQMEFGLAAARWEAAARRLAGSTADAASAATPAVSRAGREPVRLPLVQSPLVPGGTSDVASRTAPGARATPRFR
jgi:hypothetical protein